MVPKSRCGNRQIGLAFAAIFVCWPVGLHGQVENPGASLRDTAYAAERPFETVSDRWQVHDVGFGIKPSFDFDAEGRVHVMGMTEDFRGVVWFASADTVAGPWNPITVSTGYFYGPGDLRVGLDDTAHLAWHNHTEEDANHVAITPQGDMTLFQIPTPGHNGWDNALALDGAGTLHQSSVNPSGFGATTSLEFGSFDGERWNYEAIPGSGPFMYGLNTSLAFDGNDDPHLVYCLCDDWATPGDLNYVHRSDGQWQVSTVATGGIRGRFPVIAVDESDRPHAAWVDVDLNDESRGFVRYAVLRDDVWNIETIDTLDDVRLGFSGARKLVSLELDSGGRPHVAYGDEHVVKYSVRNAVAEWNTVTVLESNDNAYNGLVVMRLDPDDDPAIAFWEKHETEAGVVRLVSPVPEPQSMILFVLGALTMIMLWAHRNRS